MSRRQFCPHDPITHCPLYVAMHTGKGGSCWPDDGELQTGCAVAKGASYAKLVTLLSVIDPHTVLEAHARETHDKGWKH